MRFRLNIFSFTSLILLLPLHQAWKLSRNIIFRYGLIGNIIASELYHGTYNPSLRFIDMNLAHGMVGYHLYSAIFCRTLSWKVITMLSSVTYCGSVFWIFRLSKKSKWWHASIHLVSALGSYIFLSESQL